MTPRYLPVQLDAANEEVKAIYADVETDVGFVPNFIKTLAHSSNFLKAIAGLYCGVLAGPTSLSEKTRQLAILKTGKLDKCQYTVAHGTELARKAGWTDEQIEAMDDYAQSDLFSYYEKEVLELAELVTRQPDEITVEFWTQFDNHFTSDEAVELITLISLSHTINSIVLALQVEPESQFTGEVPKPVHA